MAQATILRRMGPLTFDVVISEIHDSELDITENPIEFGTPVSDHAYMLPLKLRISAGVSDNPMTLNGANRFGQGPTRSISAYQALTQLQREAEPFNVQTGLKLYRNMLISSIHTEQDKDSSSILAFEADLKEVIIVSTQTVKYKSKKATTNNGSKTQSTDKQATPKKGETARQASPTVDKGEIKGKEISNKNGVSSAENAPRKTSLLKKLKDML
jgi:hypothetical protein